ncbi:MAG: hypothetical protein F6K41_31795 [Symploca sp. SIO3E6]|nr:hypothetical protein [Caldora sp. SIO3E6]
MGFFTWLGGWLDRVAESVFDWLVDVTTWIVERLIDFVQTLFQALQNIWSSEVASVLLEAFGVKDFLHVIFYAAKTVGWVMMEIWDSNYVYSKPSQVFKVQQSQALRMTPAPQNSPLPQQRSQAKVLKLENY